MDQENWLLLTQYAQKHTISVSTLRRHIKKGKVAYRLTDNKYYIRDVPISDDKDLAANVLSTAEGLKEILEFCKQLAQEKEKMYQEILRDKIREIMGLKERIAEQKMLIQILEEKLRVTSPARSVSPQASH